MVVKRRMAIIMALIMMVTMWPVNAIGADIGVPPSISLASDDGEVSEIDAELLESEYADSVYEDWIDALEETELDESTTWNDYEPQYYGIITSAAEMQQYKFVASVDLSNVDQNAPISSGAIYGEGYFELVGDAKRGNSSTLSLELSKDAGSSLQFTTAGTSTVTIAASSTGGSNTSAVALWDSGNNAQVEIAGIATVAGTSATTLVFENLAAGTYRVVSPPSEYNRGVRVLSVTVDVESTGDSSPTYSVDFTSKAAVQYAGDTYVSTWDGLEGKLTGSYNGTPFDLLLVGGNTSGNGGVYRPNGNNRNLTTQNADGPILIKAPFKIEVDMSTESSETPGVASFIVKSGTDSSTELARVETANSVSTENRGIYTLVYSEVDDIGQQLFFEVNRGGTGSRACIYSIKIYEISEPVVDTPTVEINSEPVDIRISKDRITANTRLNVTAEALNTSDPWLTYQWYSSSEDGTNSIAISGAIDANYIIPAETEAGTYYYYCVISADGGTVTATTRVAKVTVTLSGGVSEWGGNTPVEWTFGFQRVSFMAENPLMYLNDALAPIDSDDNTIVPIMQNGVLLLPYSAAIVALGEDTIWNATDDIITATYGGQTAELTVNSLIMNVGASSVTLAAAPEIFDGIIYVPVAAVADALKNASVGWDMLSGVITITTGAVVNQNTVQHGAMNNQPAQWYGSAESLRLADNLLLFQRASGGWYKNVDFGVMMTDQLRDQLLSQKDTSDATIDNGATVPEIRYLIKVYQATKIERYRDAYMLGINGVLNAQYPTGGFPQYIDQRTSYHGEITFNDDAMAHILRFWLEILNDPSSFFSFDADLLERVETSLIRAIDVILDTQIYSETQGMLTAWCAQHDRETLVPTWARAYEPPSVSGMESIGVLRFLMDLDQEFLRGLDDEDILGETNSIWERVQHSIHSAVAFFTASEIYGLQHTSGSSPWGGDRILVANPEARGIWGRFIDIETFEPLFVDRPGGSGSDSIIFREGEQETYGEAVTGFMIDWKHAPAAGGNLRNIYGEDGKLDIIKSYARLSHERRNGYQFIGDYGLSVPAMYNAWLVRNGLPIPVTEISGIFDAVTIGSVTLDGVVVPANASQQGISWQVVDAGSTGASISGNVLTTTNIGTVKIRATVAGGNFDGTAFTQDFTIEVKSEIPVTNITGVPTFLPIGTYNFNRLTVIPENSPTKDFVLTVVNDGGTGASFTGSFLTTTAAGTVTVLVTVANGADNGEDYTQSFDIKIHGDPTVDNNSNIPSGALISDWKVDRSNLSNNGNWNTSYGKNFGVGSPLFVDRAHAGTFNVSAVPEFLVGLDWIQTSMDARNGLETSQMTFTVNKDVTVYLAVEMRTDMKRIGWVDDTWEFMGVDVYMRNSESQGAYDQFAGIANTGNGKHYLYKKAHKAGDTVRLGAINQGTSLCNMMFILDSSTSLTVKYDANGATEGSVPVDNAKYNEGDTVTVIGNTGALIKSGYSFMGWSTQPSTASDYTAGSTFVMGASNVTLYAVWAPVDVDANFLGIIDSPVKDTSVSGWMRVAGWALGYLAGETDTIKTIDITIDGNVVGTAERMPRPDVELAVGGYKDYDVCGFSQIINLDGMANGNYTMQVRAFNTSNVIVGVLERVITIEDGKYAFLGIIDFPERDKAIPNGEFDVTGWMLCNDFQKNTLIHRVSVFLDGTKQGDAVLFERSDLKTAIPGYDDYTNSGFLLKLNGANIGSGQHTITVTAYDKNDRELGSLYREVTK